MRLHLSPIYMAMVMILAMGLGGARGKQPRFSPTDEHLQARIEVVITPKNDPGHVLARDTVVALLDQGREVGHPFAFARSMSVKEAPYMVRCPPPHPKVKQDGAPWLCEHGYIETRLNTVASYFQQTRQSDRKGQIEIFVSQRKHVNAIAHEGNVGRLEQPITASATVSLNEGQQVVDMIPFVATVSVVFEPAEIHDLSSSGNSH